MKKALKTFIAILAAFVILAPAPLYARTLDTVNIHGLSVKGKVTSVTDGLIVIQTKGVDQSYIRADYEYDQHPDYVTFRKSALSRKKISTPCHIMFVDTWVVKIKTAYSERVEIPRWRVTDLEINIK